MQIRPPHKYGLRSPKHIRLAEQIRKRIANNTFDEEDVRQGLILIRETADGLLVDSKAVSDSLGRLKQGLPLLVDLCHSVAHPSVKDRGAIRDFVKNTDAALKKAHEKMPAQRLIGVAPLGDGKLRIDLAMPPAIKPLPTMDVALAFQIVLEIFTTEKIDTDHLFSIQGDISLCLFSILHYCQIPLWSDAEESLQLKDRRGAYLALHSYQGEYHLYAGVANSLQYSEKRILDMRQQDRLDYAIFPVFSSIAPVGDGIELDMRPNGKPPIIVVAVRCDDGKLRLKEI